MMDNRIIRTSNFVRNSEGSSSVRLRRRKDPNNPVFPVQKSEQSDFQVKKRNRHSGDFYHGNYVHHPVNNIVIPVNRFSMFETENRMETLDRRIPENNNNVSNNPSDLWKVPLLSRPPISGTGLRPDYRRSCDLSGSTGKLLDNDDVKTDVNRNVSNDKHKVNSKSALC